MSKAVLADICIWLGILLVLIHVLVTVLAAFRPAAVPGVMGSGPISTLIEKTPLLGAGVFLIALGAVLHGYLDTSIAFGSSDPLPTPSPSP